MSVAVATIGNKGRLVVPLDVRSRYGWDTGTSLLFVESETGVSLVSADDALARFRASIKGTSSPVDELLAERRSEAAREAGA
jgi:bifunctional DNA-binding transcriptional regulator/antitoxin component of YhaV-PrlF toxin-antitoxin module